MQSALPTTQLKYEAGVAKLLDKVIGLHNAAASITM